MGSAVPTKNELIKSHINVQIITVLSFLVMCPCILVLSANGEFDVRCSTRDCSAFRVACNWTL